MTSDYFFWQDRTPFISSRLTGENLKGSALTARACLMDANSIDAGGSWIEIK